MSITTDAAVQAVAYCMPFAVRTQVDMGGSFALQINLGHRYRDGFSYDRAAIGTPGNRGAAGQSGEPVWWFEAREGEVLRASEYTIDTDPATVARWIADMARVYGCPAAR